MTIPLEALRRGDLAGATHIKLSEGLVEFPPELFGLADSLEMLDLSGNALTALPKDLGRLKKLRVLFCSNNRFKVLPPALGDCAALTQIGFRGAGVREVPMEALPPDLRWLTLTDNRIETLPDGIGARRSLQKLMLAGNRLTRLPESLSGAPNLELLRLAANRFEQLPAWVAQLPRLAWLAYAGNLMDRAQPMVQTPLVRWSDLTVRRLLGEGASGEVLEADWAWERVAARPVALKLFKGAITSDGLPEREMAARLAAGDHLNLIGVLGQLKDHPQNRQGLIMPLLPPHWRVLAGPPSLESCTRDVYPLGPRLDLDVALSIAGHVGRAVAHLHQRGILHGDLYAHNVLWDGACGEAVLSDFGAASLASPGDRHAYRPLDVRAWGVLLGELLDLVSATDDTSRWRTLQASCLQPNPLLRPSMPDALTSMQPQV